MQHGHASTDVGFATSSNEQYKLSIVEDSEVIYPPETAVKMAISSPSCTMSLRPAYCWSIETSRRSEARRGYVRQSSSSIESTVENLFSLITIARLPVASPVAPKNKIFMLTFVLRPYLRAGLCKLFYRTVDGAGCGRIQSFWHTAREVRQAAGLDGVVHGSCHTGGVACFGDGGVH